MPIDGITSLYGVGKLVGEDAVKDRKGRTMRWLFGRDLARGDVDKRRYLLFDSECMGCSGLAHSVERETEGGISARSLRDPYARKLLSEVKPEWSWEPTLLELEGGRAAAFTGLSMKVRLLAALGPRKAARLAKLARGVGKDEGFEDSSARIGRGEALRTLGVAGLRDHAVARAAKRTS